MPDFSVFGEGFDPSQFAVSAPGFDPSQFAVDPMTYGGAGKVPGGFAGTSPLEPGGATTAPPSMINGLRYIEPTLQAAQPGRFDTPYYAAKTNSGDLAAATYAAEGQKVRLVDPKTGAVLYEGVGPEGAKYATGIANALSEDRGRKASWSIELDKGDSFQQTGYDRKDPKNSLLGTLGDIALPILGAALMPVTGGMSAALAAGLGAAGGSAVSSLAQGRSLENTLLRAGISGLGAGVVGPAVGRFAAGPGAAGAGGAGGAGVTSVGGGTVDFGRNLITNAAGQVFGNPAGSVAELLVQGGGSALPSVLGAGAGALAPNVMGAATNASSTAPQNTPQGTEVDEVVVTATDMASRGATIEQLIAAGIPAGIAVAAIQGAGGVVTNPNVPVAATPPGNVPGLTPTNVTGPPQGLLDAIRAGPEAMGRWITANPLLAAQLGIVAAGAVDGIFGGSGGGSRGGGGLPANTALAGTRESLDPIFNASLPPSRFSVPRTQNDMSGTDWSRYGMGPQKRFFTDPPRMRKGGQFAVKGLGDGRADRVPALLSDGEYVVDAETVALLGNGSTDAGADMLDKFRVSVRKHKGKDLAAGRFSAKAKRPEAYMKGAR
jgi:hypothetical protein